MTIKTSVLDSIFAHADGHPDRIAIATDNFQLNYGQLRSLAVCFALHLERQGVKRGSVVALGSDDLVVGLACLLATAMTGASFVRGTADLCRTDAVEVSHWLRTAEQPPLEGRSSILVDHTWAHPPEGHLRSSVPQFEGFRTGAATWLVVQTSGTTGSPKFVPISYDAMLGRAKAAERDFVEGQTRLACLFPFTSFPFIVRAISALVHGCTIAHSGNPGFWIRAGVTLVMGSPRQVQRLFAEIGLKNRLPCLHVGGAPTSEATARELLQYFEAVVDVYGSTEANQVCRTIRTLADDGTIQSRSESVLGTEFQIVDSEGMPVAAETEGIVRVRSPYMATRYLNAPEAERIAFRDGWFYPGDVGRKTETGALVVTGRMNDILNIGGVKLNAQAVDTVLQGVPGIKDAISFGIMREKAEVELAAFLSVDPKFSQDEVTKSAQAACRKLSTAAVPSLFLYAADLPRNAAGKPDRLKCEYLALDFRRRVT